MKNIEIKPDLVLNNINDTDSYKFSHWMQYPKGMNLMFSYLESRGGEFDTCTLFGLQVIIHKHIAKKFSLIDINEAQRDADLHGEPFNREGFLHILNKYDGHMPVRIRAIPEGLIVPVKNAIMTIESINDPECFWITNWLETKLSRVWYPSTIAIMSREVKKTWKQYLELSSDNPDAEIGFKHHDFGARGVTSQEQAMFGGAAHLLSFLGSDSLAGIKCANYYYDEQMSGFSIPATEHSTMTVWGRDGEYAALKNWVQKTLVERIVPVGVPKLSACVGDSYDIYKFVEMICSQEIQEMIVSSGGTLIVRPDSGDPSEVLPKMFAIFEKHGLVTKNSKNFKILQPHLRIIWGDGINRRSMKDILKLVTDLGWSASNIAFGSGGGLLQDVNRDTQKFAFKCSYAQINGEGIDVRKDPITDPRKKSKAGRLDLIKTSNGYQTICLNDDVIAHPDSVMVTVFNCGKITNNTTFAECRERMTI